MTSPFCLAMGKGSRSANSPVFNKRLIAMLISTVCSAPALAGELPTGASVAAGQVTIGQTGTAVNVTQHSNNAIVNWNSFSVGKGNSVEFVQPSSSSAILNRVTGSTKSNIAGSITANGQVYLVNPNGIAISPTGTVKAGGGFVASTLDIKDEDFMKGKRTFTGKGNSAEVSNSGVINVGRGGYAALIGGSVKNDGLINVPVGKVGLGAAESATLDLSGDGFLQVAVPGNSGIKDALIQNSGKISANGGSVVMTAATAKNAARNAINLSGVVEADSVSGKNGSIVISGGEGGNVAVSGTLTAKSAEGVGGKISVTGDSIALAGAKVDASGKTGGGTINIGGERQGKGSTQRATTTVIDSASLIKADATAQGNGGDVVVWSDNKTTFNGKISARGAGSGKGGEAEVSGKAKLAYTGTTDLSSESGTFGNLLLDPHNVVISSAQDSGAGFSANADDSIINVGTLQTALAGANVTVSTGSTGSQNGDITLASNLSWSADTKLTLAAAGNIALNGDISATGTYAGLALNYGTGKDYSLLSGKSVTLSGANSTLSIGGQNYTLIRSMAQLDAIDTTGLNGKYALAQDLSSLGFSYGSSLVGADQNSPFSGTFTGLGHKISDLTIASTDTYLGLFGYNTGIIRNIAMTAAQFTGAATSDFYAGLLAGFNTGTIAYASVDGSITRSSTATTSMGGLVGYNAGLIDSSRSGVVLTAANSSSKSYWGGLVGQNSKNIIQSYFDGTLNLSGTIGNGLQYVGGLTGLNTVGSTLSQSYSSGNLTATGMSGAAAYIGGLVGNNMGAISNVYVTGTINTGRNGYTGGIAGGNQGSGSIDGAISSATISYTTAPTFNGGILGYLINGKVSNAYWNSDKSSKGIDSINLGTGSTTGLTTAQMQDSTNYTGLDKHAWALTGGSATPALFGFSGVVGVGQMAVYGANPVTTYYGAGFWNTISGSLTNGLKSTDSVGNYSLDTTGLSATNANGQAINIVSTGATVTPANLVITTGNGSKVYGGWLTSGIGFSSQGLVNGDVVYGLQLNSSGLDTRAGVGTYSLTGSNADGIGLSNYNISYGSSTFTVTPAALTITAGNGSKTYGNAVNLSGFNTSGLLNGDTVTGLTLTSAGAAATAGVGSYAIAASNATGSGLSNYVISYANGALNVTPAALTISASNYNKTYGDVLNPFSYTISGLKNGDTVSGITLASAGAAASADVGSYSVTASNATGNRLANYLISYNNGTLNVTPATLVVNAANASKTYGDAASLSSYNVVGLKNGDTVTNVTLNSAGTATTANVGSYSIIGSDAAGTGLSNYLISYNNGTLNVTPAALAITAGDASKIYGQTSNLGGFSVNGLKNGDTVSDVALNSAGAAMTAGIGSYAIAASNASGNGLSNYTIAYNDGSLNVTPAALTINAGNASKAYGETANVGDYNVVGLLNGDTVTGLSLNSAGAAGTANVGSYSIVSGDATGNGLSNYLISYNNGTLNVTPVALNITAGNASKTYGQSANLSDYSVSGLVNGDTVTGLALNSEGTAGTANVGRYGIVGSNAVGNGLSNYLISYSNGSLNVTPAALTITANSGSKISGNTAQLGYSASGLLNGDAIAHVDVTSAGASSSANAGSYAVIADNAAGNGLSNYDINYVEGVLAVDRPTSKPLAATISSQVTGHEVARQVNGADMIITHDGSDSADNSVIATADPRLAGAVCSMGADLALSCSGK